MPRVTEAHSEARRIQILDAAVRCFARDGVHPTTMQDIFRESGLSAGAIYHYFPSKAEIVEAVLIRSLQESLGTAEHAALAEDPVEVFRGLLIAGLHQLDRPESQADMRFGLLAAAEALRDPRLGEKVREIHRRVNQAFAEAIREAQRVGRIDPALDPELTARMFFALFEGFRTMKLVDPAFDTERFAVACSGFLDSLTVRR